MDPRLGFVIDWLRRVAGSAPGLVVPVSGGSDSALCYWLCTQALPRKVTAVHFGAPLRASEWFEGLAGTVEYHPAPDGDPGQREVRRWMTALELSVTRGHWLTGSRNRTEEVFGTFSVASRVAGCLPLAGLWKSEVMDLCQQIRVPPEVVESSRRADPDCGRPPELAEIGPELIDVFLRVKEGELPESRLADLGPSKVQYLEGVRAKNAFKRLLPGRPPAFAARPG